MSEQSPSPATKSSIPKKALIPLLLLTAFVVAVKLRFEHYNLLFPIIIICIIVIILKRYRVSRDYRVLFLAMLAINFLCLVIPDRTVYKFRKSHRYFWSEKPLDISHFRTVKNDRKSDTTAIVCPIIVGKINRVYNFPPAILFTSDYIGCSWIDTTGFDESPKSKEALKIIFEHEKRHLDIMEIHTRKALDSINKMIFHSYKEKYNAMDYFITMSDSIQLLFDRATDYGTNEEEHIKWNRFLNEELKKPR